MYNIFISSLTLSRMLSHSLTPIHSLALSLPPSLSLSLSRSLFASRATPRTQRNRFDRNTPFALRIISFLKRLGRHSARSRGEVRRTLFIKLSRETRTVLTTLSRRVLNNIITHTKTITEEIGELLWGRVKSNEETERNERGKADNAGSLERD